MNTTTVAFTCHDCNRRVVVNIDALRLTLDPADPSVVVVLETCHAGHTREQRLDVAEHGHLIEALLAAGVHAPDGSDIEDHLAALTDATAWLHSGAFDTDRAALRLTGGAA